MGWKWQKSGDSVRKGIKKVPFSHVIATFFVFSLVSGEVESSLVGKSGREISISMFAMIISCPELVKIKRGNKIKVVRSGVAGTAGVMVGVSSGTDVITTDRVGAHSRADGHGRGHDGGAQREIWRAQRDGCEGGCGVGELRLCGTPY